jgi:hypothetical protein
MFQAFLTHEALMTISATTLQVLHPASMNNFLGSYRAREGGVMTAVEESLRE